MNKHTITINNTEHAEGSYNMSYENTISSIDISSDEINQKTTS